MKTKQEQINEIKQIIDERVETNLGQVQGRHDNVIKTVDTTIIARDIINAGYGDVKQAKIDVLKELRERIEIATDTYFNVDGGYCLAECVMNDIDTLIEEVENENARTL